MRPRVTAALPTALHAVKYKRTAHDNTRLSMGRGHVCMAPMLQRKMYRLPKILVNVVTQHRVRMSTRAPPHAQVGFNLSSKGRCASTLCPRWRLSGLGRFDIIPVIEY